MIVKKIDEMKSVVELLAYKKELEQEWDNFHKSNPFTCYSYPVHQVKRIEERIKLISK